MCVVTFSILPVCKHEVPTIEYCSRTTYAAFEEERQKGNKVDVPSPCSEGIGWTLFKHLDGPVGCKGCKTWLALNGKQTYHNLTQLDLRQAPGNNPSSPIKEPEDGPSSDTTQDHTSSSTIDNNSCTDTTLSDRSGETTEESDADSEKNDNGKKKNSSLSGLRAGLPPTIVRVLTAIGRQGGKR